MRLQRTMFVWKIMMIGLAVLLGGNLRIADLGRRRSANLAHVVAHPPDREGDDQQAQQPLGEPVAHAPSHLIEHWSYVSELLAGQAPMAAAFRRSRRSTGLKGIPSALTRSRGIL